MKKDIELIKQNEDLQMAFILAIGLIGVEIISILGLKYLNAKPIEFLIGFPLLIITIFLIYKTNPRYCSRCSHGTYFPMIQHLQNNPNFPLQRYCLKCYFYINMSTYKCSKCGNTGNHRIHELGFLHRFLVLKQRKNVYKSCQCGNIVELIQK